MNKEITIIPPEGYELDVANSSFEMIIFKMKEVKLPTKWDELKRINGFFISSDNIYSYSGSTIDSNKNLWPTKELAEAALALSQLMQLRQRWIGDWVPDWSSIREDKKKHCIIFKDNYAEISDFYMTQRTLSFPDDEMANKFLNTFKDLIEVAKPLI